MFVFIHFSLFTELLNCKFRLNCLTKNLQGYCIILAVFQTSEIIDSKGWYMMVTQADLAVSSFQKTRKIDELRKYKCRSYLVWRHCC